MTIYRWLRIGRDGHLDQSEANDISWLVREYHEYDPATMFAIFTEWFEFMDSQMEVYVRGVILTGITIYCISGIPVYGPLGYERVYLPLCQVADTPFHI